MRANLSHLTLILAVVLSLQLKAQQFDSLSNKAVLSYSNTVTTKIQKTQQQLSSLSQRALNKLEKQERQLYVRLYKIDSVAANNIFSQSSNHYKEAQQTINNTVQQVNEKFSGEYIAYLDTLTNGIAFLKEGKELVSRSKEIKEKLNSVSEKVKEVNNTIQKTEQLKRYISQRKEYLKSQLGRYTSLNKELMRLNKTVFYYRQQAREIKEALKDPKKAEDKVMTVLREIKPFREFMERNSFLAGIFNIPQANNGVIQIGNLQTRALVTQNIQTRLSIAGPNAQQQMQRNIQSVNQQLQNFKNKLPFLNANNDDLPEFKPNTERMKPFKNRFQFGANFQTQRAQNYFPTTTDIAFSVGYKLNPKSVFGVGSSFKMGWGTGIDNIRVSAEGASIRSFLDWKLKGSIWVTGGYEQNYLSSIRRISQASNIALWKQSALIGISKTADFKSKFFKKTKVQVLYDAFWRLQSPTTQPVIFRVGYNF
jgi:hypothetical protein